MTRRWRPLLLMTVAAVLAVLSQASCGKPVKWPPAGADRFFFVQITDTHFGSRDHLERTHRLVDQINRLPVEIACVVHTGDVFSDNLEDAEVAAAGVAALRRLRAPLHILPGNHDILPADLANTAAAYRKLIGPLSHSARYHGVMFLFAYTEPLALGFELPGFDAMKELESALAQAAGGPVIVFHHRPAVDDYYEYRAQPGWGEAARARLEQLLLRHNVRAVITGHFHRDELHWLEHIPVFAAPPVAGFWGRQASFRLYEYRAGQLSYRTLYLEK